MPFVTLSASSASSCPPFDCGPESRCPANIFQSHFLRLGHKVYHCVRYAGLCANGGDGLRDCATPTVCACVCVCHTIIASQSESPPPYARCMWRTFLASQSPHDQFEGTGPTLLQSHTLRTDGAHACVCMCDVLVRAVKEYACKHTHVETASIAY